MPQQNFWDFLQSLNSNFNPHRDPGYGVDHHNAPPFPPMPGGFPFGGPQGHPPHPPPPPPPGSGPWGPVPPEWAFWFNNLNGQGPWGGRGRRGPPRYDEQHPFSYDDDVNMGNNAQQRENRNTTEKDAAASPETMQEGEPFPDPAEVTPSESDDGDVPPPSYPNDGPAAGRRGGRGHHGRGGHAHAHSHGRGRCGGGGGGRRGGWRRGGGGPFFGPGAADADAGPPFDFPGMMRGFMAHPFFRNLRDQAERYYHPTAADNTNNTRAAAEADDSNNTFAPPIDIFNTPEAFILHTALPGAKKEDIGVTWNPQSRMLRIAGVVHRPGDEAFLQTLTSVRERRVGVFEREVKLPPEGDDDNAEKKKDGDAAAAAAEDVDVDVDGFGITARMEEGVLIVTVPKVEREWMEVRKVDIE